MENVTKVCLQLAMSEIFLSLFPHSKGMCYRLNEKSVSQVGFLYAFLNDEDAISWIKHSIKEEHFLPVIEQIKAHGARLCLLRGETTRIACKFSAAIRHIPSKQLKASEMTKAFWSSGSSDIHKQLLVFPDPDGSVLIPDFTPRTISLVVE